MQLALLVKLRILPLPQVVEIGMIVIDVGSLSITDGLFRVRIHA